MLLQPTTPFRTANLIDKSISMLENRKDCSSIVSIVDVGAYHPYRMYKLEKHSEMKQLIKGRFDPMCPRQSLPKLFIRSGDIYLTTYKTLFEEDSLIGSFPIGLEIDHENAINIDSLLDLQIARELIKKEK